MSDAVSPAAASTSTEVLVRIRDVDRAFVDARLAAVGLTATTQTAPGASPRAALLDPEMMGSDAAPRLMRAAELFQNTPMLLLAGAQDRASLAALVDVPTIMGIVARDTRDNIAELDEALALLTQPAPANTLAGSPSAASSSLDRLVPATAPRLTRELIASLERDQLLEDLETFFGSAGIRSRMAALARDAIEELVTNAIYDAPTDEAGRRLYADTDRKNTIVLAESARPRLEVAVQGTRIAAGMTDPHGSLDLATVRRFLAQGLRGDLSDKAGGAGLGFARIYGLVDRLMVQVTPRRRTTIAFTLEAGTVRRDPAQRPTGLLMWAHPA